ncbi:MAG: hypothetical protein V1845_04150 [bacterium]
MRSKNRQTEELRQQVQILSHQKETLRIELARANRKKEELRQNSNAFLTLIKTFLQRLERAPRDIKKAIVPFQKNINL